MCVKMEKIKVNVKKKSACYLIVRTKFDPIPFFFTNSEYDQPAVTQAIFSC